MPQENIARVTFRFISREIIGDVLYFPFWWYSTGLKERTTNFAKNIKDVARQLSLVIWLKNMFVPMYGYTDWISRLISFVMRVIMLAVKLVGFIFWLMIYLVGLMVYILLPIFIIFFLLRSFDVL